MNETCTCGMFYNTAHILPRSSDCAEVAPSGEAGNEEIAQRLWDVSVDLVKLKPEEIHPKLL